MKAQVSFVYSRGTKVYIGNSILALKYGWDMKGISK